jgi:iron complex transport system permease protein
MNLLLSLASQSTSRVLNWLLGYLGEAAWWQIATLAIVVPVGVRWLSRLGRSLDALSFGDETAHAVGVDVSRLRRQVIVLTALLTATAVAFSGVIGFIGLLAPHAVRALVGPAHRPLVPLSALLGGALLVLADLLSRTLLPGTPIPIGVVTALLGAPVFALLLRRSS